MAFCNTCGANLNPGTRFCNKCGAAVLASTPVPPATSANPTAATSTTPVSATAPAPASQGGGVLKVILIAVAVIVVVGILGLSTLAFITWRIARHSHIRQEGDHVKVETPFGSVESTQDPEEVARNLGVETYPGARALKEGAASATFGAMHTTSATFETDDSVDKVCTFYKSKFPKAMSTTSDQEHCTIISNDRKNMITLNIESEGDKTKIQITNVSGKPESEKPSSD